MTLAALKPGESATITGIAEGDESRYRLAELGLVAGQHLTVSRLAPLGDPLAIVVMNYELCLRKRDAECILVERTP